MHLQPRDTGWIEVVCGSMFSGKTQELIRRLRLAEIARQKVQSFKPQIDDRYHPEHIVSHDKQSWASVSVPSVAQLLAGVDDDTQVIGIDEVQFFGIEVVDACQSLADQGRRVIVAGLDQDYLAQAFEPMPQLLAVAEFITKNMAICVQCGNPANRSQRLDPQKGGQVVVGSQKLYEARCRRCFEAPSQE